MGQFNSIHTNFTSGELSPKMFGRVDIARYNNGASQMENNLILQQGGATRRPGTYFAAEVKDSSALTALIEFKFSQGQAYIIEAGNLYFRFYKNNGRIEPVPGTPYEIVSPFTTAQVQTINYFQSNDQIYIFTPDQAPQVLTRFADSNWTIVPLANTDGPYQDINTTTTTIALSGTTGSVTVTASSAIFAATDVGRQIRKQNASAWGWLTITGYTNSTHVTATVQKGSFATAATTNWRLGAWSDTTGWPQIGIFHQQRLVGMNTTDQPDSIWMSESASFTSFTPSSLTDSTVVATNAITITLTSTSSNAIQWCSSSNSLLVGTEGAEWSVAAASTASPLAPANIQSSEQSQWGGARLRTRKIGVSTLYVQSSGREIKEMTYDIYITGYDSKTMSILAEHLFVQGGGISETAWQQMPFKTYWFLRSADGRLIGFTYIKEQDIYGFHRHTIGGTFSGGNAVVEDIASIPTPDKREDQLWMIVKRTIGGATKRYVEYMTPSYEPVDENDKNNMVFSDCSLTYIGSPTTTVSGLDHLKGETVHVLGDGGFIGTSDAGIVVSNTGTITFPPNFNPCSTITCGLAYTSQIGMLRPEGGGDHGTAQGKIKRPTKYVLRVYNSLGFEASPDGINWQLYDWRDTANPVQVSPPLRSGDIKDFANSDYTYDGTLYFRQTKPYPLTILAIMLETVVNE